LFLRWRRGELSAVASTKSFQVVKRSVSSIDLVALSRMRPMSDECP
jgi:hypothetical protein